MHWLTVTEYLCHKLQQTCYVYRNHNAVLSSLMTCTDLSILFRLFVLLATKTFKLYDFPHFDYERTSLMLLQKCVVSTKYDTEMCRVH